MNAQSRSATAFLDRLLDNAVGAGTHIGPRLPSLFEPEGRIDVAPYATGLAPIETESTAESPVNDRTPRRAERAESTFGALEAAIRPDLARGPSDGAESIRSRALFHPHDGDRPVRSRAPDEPEERASPSAPRRSLIEPPSVVVGEAFGREIPRVAPAVLGVKKEIPDVAAARTVVRVPPLAPPDLGEERAREVLRMARALASGGLDGKASRASESDAGILAAPPGGSLPIIASDARGPRSARIPPERPIDERAEPVVHVTIGRLEVRAMQEPATAPRTEARSPRPMSLDSYLKGRREGAR